MPTTQPFAVHPSCVTLLALLRLPALVGVTMALGGCNGAFVGNFVVLGLTLGVFFGTLGLGRAQSRAPRVQGGQNSAERSHSDV
jgi:hypothetical protein